MVYLYKRDGFQPLFSVIIYNYLLAAGMPLGYLFNPRTIIVQISRSKFFSGIYFDKYISVILVASICMIIGVVISKPNEKQINFKVVNSNKDFIRRSYYYTGILFLLFFAAYMGINFYLGNIPIGAYGQYKVWAGNGVRNYSQIAFWIASVFICGYGTKKQIKTSLLIFIIPSLILLLAGNRNDILYPFLIGFSLYVLRFKKIPKLVFVLFVFLILVVSPLIIQLRNGFGFSFYGTTVTTNIAQSLFEIGGQLPPVSNMFSWMENGEGYAHGMSIILGLVGSLFNDFIPSLATYIENSPYWLQTRLATMGFSMAAEIYYNFSILGEIVFFIFIGYKVNGYKINSIVWNGFLALVLLIWTRNSFAYSLVYLKVLIIMLLIKWVILQILRRDSI
jgi:oligosaccharide repeat unit polymerase